MKRFLTHQEVAQKCFDLSQRIKQEVLTDVKTYAIPRGGIPVTYLLHRYCQRMEMVERPEDAYIFVDDIIDSGATREKFQKDFPNKKFYALVDKTRAQGVQDWIVFPWEGEADSSIEDNIRRLLQFVGEDSQRGGLLDTPKRVAKAWRYWCSGYEKKPEEVIKTFEDGAEAYDEMVVVKDIPIYSHCEHHLAAIFGTATIAYIPNGRIVGLSKLSRLADIYSRRLQVQERLTNQIADALDSLLSPKGVGVLIKARHLCMESRGICQQGHHTITSAVRGVMRTDPSARAEFLDLCRE